MARILVVDDLPDLWAVTALRAEGHNVDVAASGKGTLLKIVQDPPDLVFLGLSELDLDGFAMLRAIRQSRAQVRVVIVSALEDEASIAKAKSLGADGYIVLREGMCETLDWR